MDKLEDKIPRNVNIYHDNIDNVESDIKFLLRIKCIK